MEEAKDLETFFLHFPSSRRLLLAKIRGRIAYPLFAREPRVGETGSSISGVSRPRKRVVCYRVVALE